MHISWRTANAQDAMSLETLDRQCFDLNWDMNTWAEATQNCQIRIGQANYRDDLIFWCGQLIRPEALDDDPYVQVVKLGVHPKCRYLGHSRKAVRDIWSYADSCGMATKVKFEVCECLLDPNWPDCFIGPWLLKMGFEMAYPVMIPAPHSLYGVDFQHAVRYELRSNSRLAGSPRR